LSAPNIRHLRSKQYKFIVGARLKNESDDIKEKVLALSLSDGDSAIIKMPDGLRLVVSCSQKRAQRDLKNRERGFKRLQKDLNKGRLTKNHINNRGYNKIPETSGRY
jgi:hypothetical protein